MSGSVPTRDGFAGKFGVLAATLGSAVGLGNIWKFPYITGENGGASFLLAYLLATLLVGLPVAVFEINWPNTTESTNRAISSMVGPESPTMPTSWEAIISPAPDFVMAVDIGIIPAISSTVVQEIAR